ncbi:hypothetical protein AKJ09_03601 [Labilithrix luteola]|uniref:Uncharacterized protein n=1 Tax=Labilithrix luteola TaxID=1391654 RepID=A0A0K1PTU2_9BACT|nr:hypothetical protein [Labilithrix luteola]AKU96937.1 hypothetical protein AKJ09_03601 [Labilithrix luteola]
MADDDKERGDRARSQALPPSVERALARARARSTDKSVSSKLLETFVGTRRDATRPHAHPHSHSGGRWLALVPVGFFVMMGVLMLPRSAPPVDVPLPEIDERALDAISHDEAMRVQGAKSTRLPGDVLALGSAIRAFNALQGGKPTEEDAVAARAAIDDARTVIGTRQTGPSDVLTLRAVQLDAFLNEVSRFESTGVVSPDLQELGGGFIDRMRDAGWISGNDVLLTPAQRRVAFKVVWNAVAGVEQLSLFQPTLDEQRALYSLYLAHPHVAESQRSALEARRAAARTEGECDRVDVDERRSLEMWRVDKIKKLGALDPEYPTAFALGVAYYRAGRYDLSIESFRSWLSTHPDGPYALRAQNHLRAAVTVYGPL